MKAYERLINYAKVYTMSEEGAETVPSTARQYDLANMLVDELKALGVDNAFVDDKCYVYGWVPASAGSEDKPALGLIAHMDTAPSYNGENVQPILHPDYDGGDIVLGDSGLVISPAEFPHLNNMKGRTLITTDGSTLLGADDKAGIAEIMTLVEKIMREGLPHPKLCIGFTPDEEIGRGADHFDVEGFGAAYAYTLDGGPENEIEYENFNGAVANIKVKGKSVHPGSSKNAMVNAALVAMEFNAMLPAGDIPRHTEDREGFFHLCEMHGDVVGAELEYILRDHDEHLLAFREQTMKHIAALLNERYGEGTVVADVRRQYANMKEMIEPHFHLIENARKAVAAAGMQPVSPAIRGGTDGAKLSFMGLPCPNLGTGGYAFHGPYEHISVEGMDKAVEVLTHLVALYA